MKLNCTYSLVGAAVLALPALTQAQPTAHYVPGVEGIKAASLPPPGVYARDYNVFYFANRFNDPDGHKIPFNPDARVTVYANVPRLIWITDLQIFGGNIGVDALVPIKWTEIKGFDRTFGLGDVFGEVTWSRHWSQLDLAFGYGVWAPTGDSDNPTQAGLGYWGHMLTAGATYYLDSDKKWSVSALGRYEINQGQDEVINFGGTFQRNWVTVGQALTIEGGIGYTLMKNLELGAVGYYQQKITTDSGFGTSDVRDRVAAIGPEINSFCSCLGISTSLRYEYEFMSEARFQGHLVALTFTKRF